MEAKYDEAAALLQQLKADSEAVKATMDTQNSKVDGAVDQVTEALQAFQVKERQREEEFMKAKEEIESLKELLNKVRIRQELHGYPKLIPAHLFHSPMNAKPKTKPLLWPTSKPNSSLSDRCSALSSSEVPPQAAASPQEGLRRLLPSQRLLRPLQWILPSSASPRSAARGVCQPGSWQVTSG